MPESIDNSGYRYGDPRRLFELWKKFSGEDLLNDKHGHANDRKDLSKIEKAKEDTMK